jgi:hypothetical protein
VIVRPQLRAGGALSSGGASLSSLRNAIADYVEAGNRFLASFMFALRADLEAMNGRVADALASADAGLSLATETGECWSDSFLFRIKAESYYNAHKQI